MTYNELLQQKEWWSKCNEILSRDHYICRDCGCLGYHNGGNYIKLNSMEELNSILKGWVFNGKTFPDFWDDIQEGYPATEKNSLVMGAENDFSSFWNNIQNGFPTRVKDIRAEKELSDSSLHIYRLNFRYCKTMLFPSQLQVPSRVFIPTTKELTTLDANVYYKEDFICRTDSSSPTGTAYIFVFDEIMSDNIYVNIEYTIPFVIDKMPHEENVINVTWGNKLMSLRLFPYNSGIRGLNIHHTYYIEGRKPWEYDNEALVTLCEDCHKKRHETSDVPLYDSNKRLISNLIRCDRCGGSGYLPQYSHVEHGICFKCGGEGTIIKD